MFDDFLDQPPAILNQVWTLLAQAPADVNHPWRLPVLGTPDDNGCDVRTLVLRQFDPVHRTLFCHTDARSPKVDQIRPAARRLAVLRSRPAGATADHRSAASA